MMSGKQGGEEVRRYTKLVLILGYHLVAGDGAPLINFPILLSIFFLPLVHGGT